eukprot:Tbor_TRINITY_DN3371_c0_g1::TRINITY_DN3371_c0_g1_i1::g.23467::m.23467
MSSVVSLQDLLRVTQGLSVKGNTNISFYDSLLSQNDPSNHNSTIIQSNYADRPLQPNTAMEITAENVEDMECLCKPFVTGTDLDRVIFYTGRAIKPQDNKFMRLEGYSSSLYQQPVSQQHQSSYIGCKRLDKCCPVSTDVPRLASVPGIPCGAFVELCGHTGCGKTTVCLATTVEALSENFVWKVSRDDVLKGHCDGTPIEASLAPDLYHLPSHQSTHVVWVSSYEGGYTTLPFSPSLLLGALQERLLSKKGIEVVGLPAGEMTGSPKTEPSKIQNINLQFSMKTPLLDDGLPTIETIDQYLHVIIGVHSPSRLSSAIQLTIPKLLHIKEGNDVITDTHIFSNSYTRPYTGSKSAANSGVSGASLLSQGKSTRPKAPSFQPAWKKHFHTPSATASNTTPSHLSSSLSTPQSLTPARVLVVIDSLSTILCSHELAPSSVVRSGVSSYEDVNNSRVSQMGKHPLKNNSPIIPLSKSVVEINRYNFLIQEIKICLQQLMTDFLSHVKGVSSQQKLSDQHPINSSCMSFLYTNGVTSPTTRSRVVSDHVREGRSARVYEVQHQEGDEEQGRLRPITCVRPSGGHLWCSLATYTAFMVMKEEWDNMTQYQCFNQTFHPVLLGP